MNETTAARSNDSVDPRIERSRRVVGHAALAELAAVGYGRFSIESVSDRCGVARSTIYRLWPGKVALIADALETLNRQPGPGDGPAGETPRQRVHRILSHLAEVFQDSLLSACCPALIEGAERDDEVRIFHHRFNDQRRQTLVEAIKAGVVAGEIADDIDPDLAAVALAGAIVYRRLMTSDAFAPARVGALIEMVLGHHPPSTDTTTAGHQEFARE